MTEAAEDDLAAIRGPARRYLADAATPGHLKALLDQTGGFDRELWRGAVEQGWPALSAPEALGGMGLGWRALSLLVQELGDRTVSLPLIAGAVIVAALSAAADAALLERFGRPLAEGAKVACLAFAEPGDSGLPACPAVLLRDGTLSGIKATAAFASVADVALLHAWDGASVALVLAELDQPAVRRESPATFDQARSVARLHFDGAAAHRLGGVPGGDDSIAQAALATAFEQIGGASACVYMARDYALQRKAFGQVIGRFQAIKHKLADMYWKTEIARGCAIDALDALDAGDPRWRGLAAAARVAATEAYDFAAQENAQTHGGLGITWEAMPHHHSRRARSLALELGAKQYWRDRMLTLIGFVP